MKGKWSWVWVYIWTVIYVLNLPIPLYLELGKSDGMGRVGVIFAFLFLWFLGVTLQKAPRRFRFAICAGVLLVAVAQFAPFLQVFCGNVAISCVKVTTGQDYFGSKVEAFFPGFAIAAINGLLLALASLIIGSLLFWIFRPFEPLRTYFADATPPKQADVKI